MSLSPPTTRSRPPRWPRLVAGLVLALALWAGGLGQAWADALIAPGSEAAVLALVAPFRDEGEVRPGVTLASIRIDAQRIVMTLQGNDGAADLVLVPQPERAAGRPSFAIEIVPTDNAALREAQTSLRDAIVSNDHGSFPFIDSGTLDAGKQPRSGVATDPLARALRLTERVAAVLAWWMVALMALLWAARAALRQRRRPGTTDRATVLDALGWIALFGVAVWARARLGFDPMHANDHAWEDAAVALGVDGEHGALERLDVIYGPAFRLAQRALVAPLGGHFEALAWLGALVGAAATVLLGLAARAVAGAGVGWIAGLACALSPLAVRVAASESDIVFGQLALAWVLAIAARPRGVPTGPAAAAGVALLALGHVVGPVWAAGAAGLAVALRHGARSGRSVDDADAQGADAERAESTLPWERHLLIGPRSWDDATREALGLALWLGLAGAIFGGLRLLDAAPMLQGRESPGGLAVSANPSMLLLTDADYASPLWWLLAVVGLAGDVALRWSAVRGRVGLGPALAGTASLAVGSLAMTLGSLLIIACVSDGLRYQSVLLLAVLIVAARGALVLAWLARWQGQRRLVAVAVVGLVALVEAARPRAGMDFVDAQIAAWRALRDAPTLPAGHLVLISPHHTQRGDAAPDVPRGRWSADGRSSETLWADVATARCAAGAPMPPGTYLLRPPSCASISASSPPCAVLDAFDAGGRSLVGGTVEIAQQWDRERPSGEFLRYASGSAPWSLRLARCPPRRGAPPAGRDSVARPPPPPPGP